MKARDVTTLLVGPLGKWSIHDLDRRTAALRANRLLDRGARGRAAPEVNVEQAATILLSLATESAAEAHLAAAAYSQLVPIGSNGKPKKYDFLACETFGETFETLLGRAEWHHDVKEVRLNRSWPQVTVVLERKGKTVVEEYRSPDAPKTGYGSGVYAEVVFRAGLLSWLVMKLHAVSGEPTSGWKAST